MKAEMKHTEKKIKLAEDVIHLSRNTLLVNLRFLDVVLNKFALVPSFELDAPFATDAKTILYSPDRILKNYMQAREKVTRDYLHTLFHCIFHHPFVGRDIDQSLWNLACDIAVENAITDLGLSSVRCSREEAQKHELKKLRSQIASLTAERIYRFLSDENIAAKKLRSLQLIFVSDDHFAWYLPPDSQGAGYPQSGGTDQKNTDEQVSLHGPDSETAKEWEEICHRVQTEIEAFGKMQGDGAGDLIQNLREVTREKYDYAFFLQRFAVLDEIMKINDEEFDYIFYTYGLNQYGNMPLIEPLEYKEKKLIRDFVIAIDTSGSVSGELVQKFIQKTFNILKSTESFSRRINLHIVQCDEIIQESVKITSQTELDEYFKNMILKGFGGTDFRPVFEYVDRMITGKEFLNLKGLLYFTDGYGTFPKQKPIYEAVFVFLSDTDYNPSVPPWASKLVLESYEI